MIYSVIGSLILEIIIVCIIYYRWFKSDEIKETKIEKIVGINVEYLESIRKLTFENEKLIQENKNYKKAVFDYGEVVKTMANEVKKYKKYYRPIDPITGKFKKLS